LLLRLEGRGLSALGFNRPRPRVGEFVLGFVVRGIASGAQQVGLSLSAGDPFVRNDSLTMAGLLNGARFTVNSVLYEEFVFRGYLLYLAMRWLGPTRATLLSAGAFGVDHWFSYGVLGTPIPMLFVFLLTGTFGYMWARAFVATGSMLAPIGMHLGWNVVAGLVFSAGPWGQMFLVPASGTIPLRVDGWPSLALNVLLPVATAAGVLMYCRRLGSSRRGGAAPRTERHLTRACCWRDQTISAAANRILGDRFALSAAPAGRSLCASR
jgi:membrane protease YdiL (CAAX protease family)